MKHKIRTLIKRYLILIASLIFYIFVISKCKNDDSTSKNDAEFLYKNSCWIETNNNTYPLIGIHNNGESVIIITDSINNKNGVIFKSRPDSSEFILYFDQKGYPTEAYLEGYIFLYDNFDSVKLDVAIIFPDGEHIIIEDVNYNNSILKSSCLINNEYLLHSDDPLIYILKGVGYALSIASCVNSVEIAAASAPLIVPLIATIPLAGLSCSGAIVGILSDFLPEDQKELKESWKAYSTMASTVGCYTIDPYDCASLVVDGAIIYLESFNNSLNDNEEIISAAKVELADLNTNNETSTLTDSRDGQIYKTIKIGNQWWMSENLNYGKLIDYKLDQSNNDTIEKYCCDNTSSGCLESGGLYQWGEAMDYNTSDNNFPGKTQGICPTGWHIPSDKDWQELEKFVENMLISNNGLISSGYYLKEIGFFEQTGGKRQVFSRFTYSDCPYIIDSCYVKQIYCYNNNPNDIRVHLWSSSEYTDYRDYYEGYGSYDFTKSPSLDFDEKYEGYSVRCVMD